MHFGFLAAYCCWRDEFEASQWTGDLQRIDLFMTWCAGGEL
jgi:hypothetical protein